jgi:peptidoglycan/LPS O-acetylase OafA/YrhL
VRSLACNVRVGKQREALAAGGHVVRHTYLKQLARAGDAARSGVRLIAGGLASVGRGDRMLRTWRVSTHPRSVARQAVNPALGRVPALDGLRGLAILLVLVYHFTIYGGLDPEIRVDRIFRHVMSVGWMGVDLFFVLSGFLITGILVDAKNQASYFRNFYMRRSLRIFPLYYGVLGVTFLVIPFMVAMSDNFDEFAAGQAWYWLYLVNVKIATEGWPEFGAIGHFWSLAVEEQFYLIWPLLVFTLGLRGLLWLTISCFLLAFAFRCALIWHGETLAAYVLGPARMDGLAAGALLAILARQPGGLAPWRPLAALVAAATGAILGAAFLWKRGLWAEDSFVGTIGYSLIALFFGAMLTLIVTGRRNDLLNGAFTSRPLRRLGRYSYGLYVFHHPVVIGCGALFFVATDFPTVLGSQLPGLAVFVLVTGAVSLLLAVLSWHYFESYFLNLKERYANRVPADGKLGAQVAGSGGVQRAIRPQIHRDHRPVTDRSAPDGAGEVRH